MATSIDGSSMWRSATTNKQIKGYSDMVLNHHRTAQPNLPPTTLILRDDKSNASGQNFNNTTSTSQAMTLMMSKK